LVIPLRFSKTTFPISTLVIAIKSAQSSLSHLSLFVSSRAGVHIVVVVLSFPSCSIYYFWIILQFS
ncbi:MAG: hypothetical protein WBQ16_10595, partial [Nitrososphaeraceae archaeon]